MRNIILGVLVSVLLALSGCKEKAGNHITFGVSADYPPFEFYQDNAIKGFDIELASLIAKEINKDAKFQDMQFSSLLAAVQNGTVDAAISTIAITPERKQNFDFSDSYYEESMSLLYPKVSPLEDAISLQNKKIACQLGSTMEIWLKSNAPNTEIVSMDNNNQSVEALKAGHVDGVLLDSVQAASFASKNSGLAHKFIAKSENGYGIVVKKDSKLKDELNHALQALQAKGELDKLKKKWLESAEWSN